MERNGNPQKHFGTILISTIGKKTCKDHGKQKRKRQREKEKKDDCTSNSGSFRKTRTGDECQLYA
jgi:hypothetical protein